MRKPFFLKGTNMINSITRQNSRSSSIKQQCNIFNRKASNTLGAKKRKKKEETPRNLG